MPNDKDIVATVVAASIFMLLIVIAAFLLFRMYLKKKNFLQLEQERMKMVYEQTLLQSQLEIQEHTFARISQEIHDNIGQVLSLIRLNINTLGPVTVPEKVVFTDELLGKVITDLRNLSHSLDANYISRIGLAEAIQQLLDSLNKTGKFITFFRNNCSLNFNQERSMILYRIIQEAVNNTLKHANATEISIAINETKDAKEIIISDNGSGFSTENQSSGLGMKTMADRAKVIGADVKVESHLNEGTIVFISLPNE